jgi:hypothetical protein
VQITGTPLSKIFTAPERDTLRYVVKWHRNTRRDGGGVRSVILFPFF